MTLVRIFALLCAVSLCSCMHYQVVVDSLSDPDSTISSKVHYVLLPGNPGVTQADLQYKEFSAYIRKALSMRGFFESPPDSAEIAIFLNYGIGDPVYTPYSYSMPIYGKKSNTSTVVANTYNPDGTTTTTTGTVTTSGKTQVVGTQQYSGVAVSYYRFYVLNAFDLDRFRKDSSLVSDWRTTITSEGSSGDLREVFPALVAGSWKYIGTNTGRKISERVYEHGDAIRQFRKE